MKKYNIIILMSFIFIILFSQSISAVIGAECVINSDCDENEYCNMIKHICKGINYDQKQFLEESMARDWDWTKINWDSDAVAIAVLNNPNIYFFPDFYRNIPDEEWIYKKLDYNK
ncbi:hypothetical protein ACFL1H_06870, partial [Nanoarchaeota archaeon]